ncbi:unnamed protein product, partial [Mesorhabditis spiculigera]
MTELTFYGFRGAELSSSPDRCVAACYQVAECQGVEWYNGKCYRAWFERRDRLPRTRGSTQLRTRGCFGKTELRGQLIGMPRWWVYADRQHRWTKTRPTGVGQVKAENGLFCVLRQKVAGCNLVALTIRNGRLNLGGTGSVVGYVAETIGECGAFQAVNEWQLSLPKLIDFVYIPPPGQGQKTWRNNGRVFYVWINSGGGDNPVSPREAAKAAHRQLLECDKPSALVLNDLSTIIGKAPTSPPSRPSVDASSYSETDTVVNVTDECAQDLDAEGIGDFDSYTTNVLDETIEATEHQSPKPVIDLPRHDYTTSTLEGVEGEEQWDTPALNNTFYSYLATILLCLMSPFIYVCCSTDPLIHTAAHEGRRMALQEIDTADEERVLLARENLEGARAVMRRLEEHHSAQKIELGYAITLLEKQLETHEQLPGTLQNLQLQIDSHEAQLADGYRTRAWRVGTVHQELE